MPLPCTHFIFRRLVTAMMAMAIVAGVFAGGLYVGSFKVWPYSELGRAYSRVLAAYKGEKAWFLHYFTEPIAPGTQIWPAVTAPEDIEAFNTAYLVPVAGFNDAYDNLTLNAADIISLRDTPVLELSFSYRSKAYKAYAYAPDGHACAAGSRSALILPGTGSDHHPQIISDAPEGLHRGLGQILDGVVTHRYVMVGPNDGFLSLHDGGGFKVSDLILRSWHLNREGSFSASYMLGVLAITKALSECHSQTGVIGLSFGGASALVAGVLARPDFVVVASGHSVLQQQVELSGQNQMVGLALSGELGHPQGLRRWLARAPQTFFIFSWGTAEPGAYGIEAQEGPTHRSVGYLPNTAFVSHPGGHHFEGPQTRAHLLAALERPNTSARTD